MAIQKDYKAIASIVRKCSTCNATQKPWQDNASYDIAKNLANYFAKDNLCFDKTKFLIACEFED